MTSDPARPPITDVGVFDFAPHHCFACGTLNTHGLGLTMHVEPGRSWTEVTLDRRFEGWEGMAHGGILCTILDEVMAWALVGADSWGVTARMSVEFRAPVAIGQAVRAEGWSTTSRRRVVDTAGRIVDATSGKVLAESQGRYVAASEAGKRELREAYGFRVTPEVGPTPDSVDSRADRDPATAASR